MVQTITSRENDFYKKLLKIQKGDKENGLFLAEGEDLFDEAERNRAAKVLLLPIGSTFHRRFNEVVFLKDSLYKALSNYKSLPPCLTLCALKESDDLGDRVVYLDGIQDPGNLGTIVRTALAFSYTGIGLSKDCVSIYNRKVIQSTKGALFSIPFKTVDLSDLKKEGYEVFLTTLDGQDMEEVPSLGDRFVLAFGNEGHGIREENRTLGRKIAIKMDNIDSLNVATASAIFLYRYGRKR